MKRTCLHTITNTHELKIGVSQNKSCEFHPAIKKTNYFRMKNKLLIILVSILLPCSVSAVITEWKSFDFTSNLILSMNQDKNGTLWFGTGAGVVKLSSDGTWTTYNKANSELYDDPTFHIMEDSDGNMWFGTYSGVSRLSSDGLVWTIYSVTDQLGGLGLDERRNAIIDPICQDKKGNIYLKSSMGIWREDWSHYQETGDSVVYDPYGGIAVIDSNETWSYHSVVSSFMDLPVNTISGIYSDNDSNLWVSYPDGVKKFDNNGTTLTYTSENSGLAIDPIYGMYCIMEDDSSNIWFGTSLGVSKLLPNGTWRNYSMSNSGLPQNSVKQIMEDRYGNLWFNSGGSAAVLYIDGTWIKYTDAGAYNTITHKYVDPQETSDYEYPECLMEDVTHFLEDNNGNVWIGTHGGGVAEAVRKSLFIENKSIGIGQKTGSQVTVNIQADVSWSTTYNTSKLSLDPSDGTPGSILMAITKTTDDADTLKIFFTGSDGARDTITILPLSFYVSREKITLDADSWSADSIVVLGNAQWQLNYSSVNSWLGMISEEGITATNQPLSFVGDQTLFPFAAAENKSLDSRTDTLLITSDTINKKIIVTQKQLLSCPVDSILLDAEKDSKDEFSIEIGKTNGIVWTATIDTNCFAIDKISGRDSSGTVSFITVTALSENESSETRSGHVTISASDLTKIITVYQEGVSAIENNLNLTGITLGSGSNTCYNAYDSIVVAGSGTSVLFQSGSSSEIIAGKTILFLPGFRAGAGSSMFAHITTDSTFCDGGSASSTIVATPVEKSQVLNEPVEPSEKTMAEKRIKVYPNPSNGQFKVAVSGAGAGQSEIQVFNLLGVKVFSGKINNQEVNEISMKTNTSGFYLVEITSGTTKVFRKIIVR